MQSFKQHLTEALDQPYKWKWAKQTPTHSIAEIECVGDNVLVDFEGSTTGVWTLEFYPKSRKRDYDLTNSGEAFHIFATVHEIMIDFIKKNRPLYVWWNGEGGAASSRARLYHSFAKNLGKRSPYINSNYNIYGNHGVNVYLTLLVRKDVAESDTTRLVIERLLRTTYRYAKPFN